MYVINQYYKDIEKLRMCRTISKETKEKEITYLLEKIEEVKAQQRYNRRKKTILKNVMDKKLIWYATLTLNESKINKDIKTLKANGIQI